MQPRRVCTAEVKMPAEKAPYSKKKISANTEKKKQWTWKKKQLVMTYKGKSIHLQHMCEMSDDKFRELLAYLSIRRNNPEESLIYGALLRIAQVRENFKEIPENQEIEVPIYEARNKAVQTQVESEITTAVVHQATKTVDADF